jgi:hypothetical protein
MPVFNCPPDQTRISNLGHLTYKILALTVRKSVAGELLFKLRAATYAVSVIKQSAEA